MFPTRSLIQSQAGKWKKAGITLVVVAGLALFTWPAQSFAADSFDLATAINACPAGGTVTVPAGTWNVPARVNVYKSVNIVGTPGQSILAASTGDAILSLYNPSGVTISGLTFVGPAANSTTSGLWLSGPVNVKLKDLSFRNLWYGLKIGTGPQGSGCSLDGLTASGTTLPLEISNLSDSSLANINIQMTDFGLSSGQRYHGIYLERSLHNLSFSGVRVNGGSGYCLQLYTEDGPSDGITFTNVTLDASTGRYPLVVWGYSNVSFRNITMTMTRTDAPCAVFYGTAANVTFDGISAAGGRALAEPYSGQTPQNIIFRNGSYVGPKLGSGVTFENVTLAASTTTTTAAPTTTTTAAPTTTTTAAPTTTTVTPTTTTSSTTTTTEQPTTTTTTAPSTTTTTELDTKTMSEPSTVAIVSPTDQSVVQGRVTVRATVASSLRVSKVRFLVDGRVLTQDYRAPYAFTWNTRALAPGSSHEITATAINYQGQEVGRASVDVTIGGTLQIVAATEEGPWSAALASLNDTTPYSEAVKTLVAAGVMTGYPDGTLAPSGQTNRAQFAKMVSGVLGLADADTALTQFTDLGPADESLYPHKFVAALTSVDAIDGINSTQFAPWKSVTRAQMVTIIVRALQKLDPGVLAATTRTSSVLGDVGLFTQTMAIAEQGGLLAGIAGYGRTWDPWAPATRGEVAQVLENMLSLD